MIRKKLNRILKNSSSSNTNRNHSKKPNLSKYGISNLSTSFTKSRAHSLPMENKLTEIQENTRDYLLNFENSDSSFQTFKRTQDLNSSFNRTTRNNYSKKSARTINDVPRVIYSKLEDDIEVTLKKLGHKRKNFEEKGPGIVKKSREDLALTTTKLEKLASILRYRKCKDILFYSQDLADTAIQTQLPSIIVHILDFFIPLLEYFNEISLIEKYSRVLMEYSRQKEDLKGKLRASEFMGLFFRANNKFQKALKRYFKMLEYSLKSNSNKAELRAYGAIGLCYYYMGEIEKSIPFERRAMSGILEPRTSRLRRKSLKKFKEYGESDSEGEEITLQENIMEESTAQEKSIDEMDPGERLKHLRSFRQAKAMYAVKKYEKEKRIIRLPGIMRRIHKEKGMLKNILQTEFSFDEQEKKKNQGFLWEDKKIFMNNHLSPFRNKMMYDIQAQNKFKSFRSKSLKKRGEIEMRQYNTYSKIIGKLFIVIKSVEREVEHLNELYLKLENSYCVHTYFYETQIRKVEEENAKMMRRLELRKQKEEREEREADIEREKSKLISKREKIE